MRKLMSISLLLSAVVMILLVNRAAPADDSQDQSAPILPANATPMTTPQQTEPFTEAFLKMLSSGNTFDAFALLKAAAPREATTEIDEARDNTLKLLEAQSPIMGKPVGFELLARRQLGQSLLRYECLLKLQRHPLRCTILYYKAADTWAPMQVSFDDDIQRLFDELTQ